MILQSIFNEMKKIMTSVEIKYRYLGEKLDTVESRYNADRYMNAYDKQDTFFSYTNYSIEAVIRSGLTRDEAIAAKYAINPTTIPTRFRDAVLREQRKYIVDNYDEMNDYFRMLNGQPPSNETVVYADLEFYEENAVEFKPLHEFDNMETMVLEATGRLDQLKKAFPDSKHINYIGSRKIEPYRSRKSANFQVLRVDYTGDSDLLDKFLTTYEQCREYVMTILYVNDFSTNEEYYDRFMALSTMIMAIQRTLVDILKSSIRREYFDAQLIKTLFDSYGVPFIETLPLEYQKLIAKNLDKLLHYKSTDKVVFDIAEILGFSKASIYKYYLVKSHRFNDDGKPVFEYTENENGEQVPYYPGMYDVYFQSVDITEKNEEFALSVSSNRQSYGEVVSDDPFWWNEDDELLNALYENEFNYVETKYMHMNVMVKITEMIFEIAHVFRLLQDKRAQSERLEIGIPKILPDRKISLFTYAMFMCACVVKKNKLVGEIVTAPSKTLFLLGFDFGNDLRVIKETLYKYKGVIDTDKISNFLDNMEMLRAKDVDRMFHNIDGLWKFLIDSMSKARTIQEYNAYEKIYRALHVTQDMSSVFKKSDGTIATTYLDMLGDLDPQLQTLVEMADDEDIFVYINHCTDSLQHVINDTKYLYGITDTSATMIEALKKMITFFKSYTVDLKEFNVIYVLDNKYMHAIKIISQVMHMDSHSTIHDKRYKRMLHDFIHICSTMNTSDDHKLRDFLKSLEVTYEIKEKLMFMVKLILDTDMSVGHKVRLHDIVTYLGDIKIKDGLRITEHHDLDISHGTSLKIRITDSQVLNVDNLLEDFVFYDDMFSVESTVTKREDALNLMDSLDEESDLHDRIKIQIEDSVPDVETDIDLLITVLDGERVQSVETVFGDRDELFLHQETHSVETDLHNNIHYSFSDNFDMENDVHKKNGVHLKNSIKSAELMLSKNDTAIDKDVLDRIETDIHDDSRYNFNDAIAMENAMRKRNDITEKDIIKSAESVMSKKTSVNNRDNMNSIETDLHNKESLSRNDEFSLEITSKAKDDTLDVRDTLSGESIIRGKHGVTETVHLNDGYRYKVVEMLRKDDMLIESDLALESLKRRAMGMTLLDTVGVIGHISPNNDYMRLSEEIRIIRDL